MKSYIKSIAVLISGLSFFHLFSTIQVYLSNIDLLNTMNVISDTGYLLMPNTFIMKNLKSVSTAFAGGVFFTLSIGTFTVLISFLASVFYFSFDSIRNVAKMGAIVFFAGLIVAVNVKGLCPVETLSFLLVPFAVFCLYKGLFCGTADKPAPAAFANHFIPVVVLAVLLIGTMLQSSKHIFIDFRDNILMSNKVGMTINDFYYDYTLYPARVFKTYARRTPKTCAIESGEKNSKLKVIEKRLLQNDYLVVDKETKPDFILKTVNRDLSFKYKGKPVLETSVSKFISNPKPFLETFSDNTDSHGFYRKITGLALITGFPLFMYILMHACFFILIYCLGQKVRAPLFASLSCFLIGVFAFFFLFSSENYAVSKGTLTQVLKSENLKERISGLRFAVDKKLDISRYAQYDTAFSENSVPEKYWFARALAQSRDSQSHATLIKFLDDPNQNVVCQALFSLGSKRKKGTIPVLINHIKNSKDWYAQWYAYRALKRLRWTQRK